MYQKKSEQFNCLIGIDFGTKNIGLAKVDSPCALALPWCSVQAGHTFGETIGSILKITANLQPSHFVVGLPLTLKGGDSALTLQVRTFIFQLQAKISPVPVVPWDERLTSAENERLQIGLGVKPKKRLRQIDSFAAATILQSYLDAQKTTFKSVR